MNDRLNYNLKAKVNSIRMKDELGNLITFLIVESSNERVFFRNYIDKKRCDIVIGEGKDNVLTILSELDSEGLVNNRALGVIDSDYLVLDNKLSESKRSDLIILTDAHDLEMLMLKGDNFDKLICMFTSERKLKTFSEENNIKDFKKFIIEEGVSLALIRWISNLKGWNLTCKSEKLNYSKFFDSKKLKVNVDLLIDEILRKSPKVRLKKEHIVKELNVKKKEICKNILLCNGHDICKMLSIAFSKKVGSKNVTSAEIENALILSYESSQFVSSSLFKDIKDWEKLNIPFVVLK